MIRSAAEISLLISKLISKDANRQTVWTSILCCQTTLTTLVCFLFTHYCVACLILHTSNDIMQVHLSNSSLLHRLQRCNNDELLWCTCMMCPENTKAIAHICIINLTSENSQRTRFTSLVTSHFLESWYIAMCVNRHNGPAIMITQMDKGKRATCRNAEYFIYLINEQISLFSQQLAPDVCNILNGIMKWEQFQAVKAVFSHLAYSNSAERVDVLEWQSYSMDTLMWCSSF